VIAWRGTIKYVGLGDGGATSQLSAGTLMQNRLKRPRFFRLRVAVRDSLPP